MHYFLVASTGSSGDVLPLLGIGTYLKARGHRVTLATSEVYRTRSKKLGLDFVSLHNHHEYEESLRDKWLLSTRYESLFTLRHALKCNHLLACSLKAVQSPDLVVLAVDRPLLWADMSQCSRDGTPLVRLQIDMPTIQQGNSRTQTLPPTGVQRLLNARIEARWCSLVQGDGSMIGPNHIARLWRSFRRNIPTIFLWPPWAMGLPENSHDTAFGFLPSLAGDEDAFFDTRSNAVVDKPLVIFLAGTAGTIQSWSGRFFEVSAAICGVAEYQGLLLGGDQFVTEIRGASIGWRSFVPLRQVLRRAHAIVHHGGIGTASAALEFGVPQLIIPRVFGQFSNAEWMRRLGVASVLAEKSYSTQSGAAALRNVLKDPGFRTKSQEYAKIFKGEEALNRLCTFVESPSIRGKVHDRGWTPIP